MDREEAALAGTPGVLAVDKVQLRWVGHRLQGAATVVVADAALSAVDQTIHAAKHRIGHALPKLDHFAIRPTAVTEETDYVGAQQPHGC